MEDLKYARPFKDRHGRVRWRFRRKGIDTYLPGAPGDDVFQVAYEAALAGREPDAPWRNTVRAPVYIRPALKRAKTRAAQQRVPFDLTEDFVLNLFEGQGWRCAVSRIRFHMQPTIDRAMQAFRPSIDRIEPQRGYVPGNVRVVCEIVNLAMNNWGEEPLRTLVRKMRLTR